LWKTRDPANERTPTLHITICMRHEKCKKIKKTYEINTKWNYKTEFVSFHSKKSHRESISRYKLILNFGTRWKLVVNFKFRPLYSRIKSPLAASEL